MPPKPGAGQGLAAEIAQQGNCKAPTHPHSSRVSQRHLETSSSSGTTLILQKHIPLPRQILHPPAITQLGRQGPKGKAQSSMSEAPTPQSVWYTGWNLPESCEHPTRGNEVTAEIRLTPQTQGSERVCRAWASSLVGGAWRGPAPQAQLHPDLTPQAAPAAHSQTMTVILKHSSKPHACEVCFGVKSGPIAFLCS